MLPLVFMVSRYKDTPNIVLSKNSELTVQSLLCMESMQVQGLPIPRSKPLLTPQTKSTTCRSQSHSTCRSGLTERPHPVRPRPTTCGLRTQPPASSPRPPQRPDPASAAGFGCADRPATPSRCRLRASAFGPGRSSGMVFGRPFSVPFLSERLGVRASLFGSVWCPTMRGQPCTFLFHFGLTSLNLQDV